MNWQSTLSWEDAKQRASILKKVRLFFEDREVIEVETPSLGKYSVTDIHLDAFETEFNYFPFSSLEESSLLYLQTSPEFCMKRLLASGYGSIYQISKAYRHESKGRFHNPEFTMLEWYRVGFDKEELIQEVSELLTTILHCDEPEIISYQDLFLTHLNIDPLEVSIDSLKSIIIENDKSSDWILNESNVDTLLQFLLSELIEPNIGIHAPIFIHNFPVSQASLAKINAGDCRVADRFECYYQGIELVNGFNELTDATEQFKRFKHDNDERQRLGGKTIEIDERFIDALDSGLPQCSGVALGVDRLVMLALNKKSIDDVMTFPVDRA